MRGKEDAPKAEGTASTREDGDNCRSGSEVDAFFSPTRSHLSSFFRPLQNFYWPGMSHGGAMTRQTGRQAGIRWAEAS
eukprot:766364-Hanusia_phi.AAC.5